MSEFGPAFKKTGQNEGGFAHNPADTGGMTVFGISRVNWPKWSGWKIVDVIIDGLVSPGPYGTTAYRAWVKHLNDLLRANSSFMQSVENFYKANFWDANRIGEIVDQDVAEWLYDHIVNGGGQGAKWMQEAAGIKADGSIGAESIKAFNAMRPIELLKKSEIIAAWYRLDKVHNKPSQAQFLNSWLSRDGVDQDIIDQAREWAKDGLTRDEVDQLQAMIKDDAMGDIKEGKS